jgi:hypothetical protein
MAQMANRRFVRAGQLGHARIGKTEALELAHT